MRDWLREHSLGLFVLAVFAAFTAATLVLSWHEYSSDQQTHGQPVTTPGYWQFWTYEYSMSLVADVFGFALIVFATKKLREIGSAESK